MENKSSFFFRHRKKLIIPVIICFVMELILCVDIKFYYPGNNIGDGFDSLEDDYLEAADYNMTPFVLEADKISIERKYASDSDFSYIFSDYNLKKILSDVKRNSEDCDISLIMGRVQINPYNIILHDGGFYVSPVIYQGYAPYDKELSRCMLLLFDKNKEYIASMSIWERVDWGRDYVGFYDYGISDLDESILKENPDKKYVLIYYMGSQYPNFHAYVDEDNNVYPVGGKLNISGNVYKKMSKYAFSYNDIVSPENLKWISLTEE